MTEPSLSETSPYGVYLQFLRDGKLAYQVTADGQPVFFPRIAAPATGESDLQWRVSAGLGAVYAVTALYPRDQTPYTVAMIDMDEGYRLMSSVRGIDAEAVFIGQRVRFQAEQPDGGDPYPVFYPADGAG